jgi:hypothetical protein
METALDGCSPPAFSRTICPEPNLLITDDQAPAAAWKNLKASGQLFILNASESALPGATQYLGGHLRQAIIDFARRHTLVSDLTSLIVLERFKDHVTYRIPPPEADLRQRYETAIARRSDSAWLKRRDWHNRDFPWAEVTLFESLRRTRIWKNATAKVFSEAEKDSESYLCIADWQASALTVIKRRPEVKSAADRDAWMRSIADAALRDSARAYEREGQFNRAVAQYRRLIDSGEIDMFTTFAQTERNNLFKRQGLRRPQSNDLEAWSNLDADIRIVMISDTGRISLKITDPLGQSIDHNTHRTGTGARLSESGYHQEFMIRRAIPGSYTITCQNRGAKNPSVQIGTFTNWGRPNQTVQWQTLQFDKSSVEISKLKFELPVG